MSRGRDLDESHLTVLDDFVGLRTVESAMESAVVFCIFDSHMIGDLLYSMTMPDVDLRDELLPQSASAYPERRSTSFTPL